MKFVRMFLLCLLPGLANAAPLKSLEPGDFEVLRLGLQGQPYIVSLWSLDCSHCRTDLQQISRFVRRHPAAKLLVINTDSQADESAIQAALAKSGLKRADLFVFGDAAPERLRFEIDRKWGGELPRNYLFDATGSVRGLSGPLSDAELAGWAQRNRVAGR